MCTGFLIIFINVIYITENDKLFHYNTKGMRDKSSLLQNSKSYTSEVDTMGQITLRELEKMDFFKEIPKDILQNLLNESKVVSYKKKEVIFHSRSRTKTVYFVYSGEVMLYNLTKHGNRKVIFILGKGRLLNQSIVSKKPNALFCEAACPVQVIEIAEKQFLQLMEQSHALTRAV